MKLNRFQIPVISQPAIEGPCQNLSAHRLAEFLERTAHSQRLQRPRSVRFRSRLLCHVTRVNRRQLEGVNVGKEPVNRFVESSITEHTILSRESELIAFQCKTELIAFLTSTRVY